MNGNLKIMEVCNSMENETHYGFKGGLVVKISKDKFAYYGRAKDLYKQALGIDWL